MTIAFLAGMACMLGIEVAFTLVVVTILYFRERKNGESSSNNNQGNE